MPSKVVVYWDARVFIDRIQRTPGRIELLEELTELAEKNELLIVTSTVTRTEVIRGPDLDAPLDVQHEMILQFFERPGIEVRPFDWYVSGVAARLRVEHKLPTLDAIHVATAIHAKIPEFHTYDAKHLLKKNGLIGDPPLKIVEPNHPDPLPMFDRIQEDQ